MKDTLQSVGRRLGVSAGIGTALAMTALVLAGPANAAGTDPAADAISDLGAKVTLYGGAMVALVVISIGIFLGIKYLRKAGAKA